MTPTRILGSLALPVLLAAGTALADDRNEPDHAHHHDEVLVDDSQPIGQVAFDADCTPAASAAFDRALGLMHHMMYVQSRSQFEAITETDPECAMAHWGVATSLFQPLWGTTPEAGEIERARAAIERARENVASKRERRLIEATAAFFEPDTERLQKRLEGWIDGMESAYEAHPDDLDIAALYSLSRLTRALWADNRDELHDEAETILHGIWERENTHPGAIHYAIHATDADGRAENALAMVESYGSIAPAVPHALHMPSHIYVRLGDWPEVIDWNTRSAEAALDHEVNGAISFHFIHAIDYLVYGHLQRGEDSTAERVWRTARDKGRHQAGFPGAFHLAAIPARLAVEQRDWSAAATIEPRVPDYVDWDRFYWPEALAWFARGLGAVHTGDIDEAHRAEHRLSELGEAAETAADARFSTYIEIDRLILGAWMKHASDQPGAAIEKMRAAAELEGSVEKHPVTPGALLPPNEALGDLFMELDQPAEALEAYARSDAIWPGRYQTLLGAARAAAKADQPSVAAEWSARLLDTAPASERTSTDEIAAAADR